MFDWGYDTEPEPRLDNRRIEAMRGKVLGGSSSINVMAYVRGHRGDYDRWARRGCPGWSYADAQIDAFVRRTAITAHHPCATCALGTGEDAVLDPDLRVRGVEGLRVADASAMPDLSPATSTPAC